MNNAEPPTPYTIRTTPEGLQKTKLWIRVFSAVICTIIVGISFALVDVTGMIYALFVPAATVGLWDVWLIVRRFVGNGSDIHPGIRVGADLFMWLGLGAVAVLLAAAWSSWGTATGFHEYSNTTFTLVKASVVLATILAFVHIALFIIACHETHVYNGDRSMFRRATKKGFQES